MVNNNTMNANALESPPSSTLSMHAQVSTLPENNPSSLSLSHRTSSLEICDLVYGSAVPSWDTVERFYDSSATYENPFITATSRDLISDIHTFAGQLAQINIPKPVALLYALFGLKNDQRWSNSWFKAVRVWNEMGDVCESESFDGHRKTMVEHTIHILLLPDLHSRAHFYNSATEPSQTASPVSSELSQIGPHSTLGLTIPSPFHLRLPVVTRLSFNEAGKITYHRDLWDVKDLLGLVPGMTLAQWISSRLLAQSIRGIVGAGRALFVSSSNNKRSASSGRISHDEEEALGPGAAYARMVKRQATANEGNMLGLSGI